MSNQNVPTPRLFVSEIERLLGIKFKYDMAASAENTKCERFFTEEDDALSIDWPRDDWCWLNPPFKYLTKWIKKCMLESFEGSEIVAVWPLSGDRNQRYVWKNTQVYIIEGRVWKVVRGVMVCVWGPEVHPTINGLSWNKKELSLLW